MLAARNAMLSGKRMPYDSQVEYLQSDGNQGILLPLVTSRDKLTVRYSRINLSDCYFCGGMRTDNSTYSLALVHRRNSDTLSRQQVVVIPSGSGNNDFYSPWISGAGAVQKDVLEVTYDDSVAGARKAVWWDGSTTAIRTNSWNVGSANALFGIANRTGKGMYSRATIRIHSYVHIRDGVAIVDLKPVRVKSVGMMYDRVTGSILGSVTSTPLIPGPDIRRSNV